MTFRLRHLLAALLLHGALVVLLVTGVQCSRPPERPPVIHAVLLDPNRAQVAQEKRQQQIDQQRKQEQQRKEQQARQEKERQEQVERHQKAVEEQKRQQAEKQRQQQIADQQRKQKETADKKKAEEARKKKEQEEAKERQEQARRDIQEQAQREDEMRQEQQQISKNREQAAAAATDRQRKQAEWAATLQDHIRKYWNRPASAPDDFSCTVHVQLLPDGSVTRAQVSRSCGNSQLDRSVEDATLRASPLPKPSDPSVFDRDLIINFEP